MVDFYQKYAMGRERESGLKVDKRDLIVGNRYILNDVKNTDSKRAANGIQVVELLWDI